MKYPLKIFLKLSFKISLNFFSPSHKHRQFSNIFLIFKNCSNLSVSGEQSTGVAPKPGSAGSSTRDAALRILQLCQKGEWPPVEQALKNLEKVVAGGGEDVSPSPLLGVTDTVGSTPKNVCN